MSIEIRVPIGDHIIEAYAHGLKIGKARAVVVDGRRTFVLAEPVLYYPGLGGALRGALQLLRRGKIQGSHRTDVSTLEQLEQLVRRTEGDVQRIGNILEERIQEAEEELGELEAARAAGPLKIPASER